MFETYVDYALQARVRERMALVDPELFVVPIEDERDLDEAEEEAREHRSTRRHAAL